MVKILILIFSLSVAISHSKAPILVKLVHNSNVNDEDHDGAKALKKILEEGSNGEIQVKIYPGSQLCSGAHECIQLLQTGALEIYIATGGGLAGFYPEISVLDLPYLLDDDQVAECVFDGPYRKQLQTSLAEAIPGVRLMVIGNTGGWRNFATTKKPVQQVADLKGLKIRTIKNAMQIQLAKSLGASPTGISWGEVYTSLATGVVEGTKNGITDIVGMKLHEHLKYIVLDGHSYMAAYWFSSEHFYQKLSPEYQELLRKGFDALAKVTRTLPQQRANDAYKIFEEAGGKIHKLDEESRLEFVKASKPLREWYLNRYPKENLDQVIAAAKTCRSNK